MPPTRLFSTTRDPGNNTGVPSTLTSLTSIEKRPFSSTRLLSRRVTASDSSPAPFRLPRHSSVHTSLQKAAILLSKDKESLQSALYRVVHHVDNYLLLVSKQKLCRSIDKNATFNLMLPKVSVQPDGPPCSRPRRTPASSSSDRRNRPVRPCPAATIRRRTLARGRAPGSAARPASPRRRPH